MSLYDALEDSAVHKATLRQGQLIIIGLPGFFRRK